MHSRGPKSATLTLRQGIEMTTTQASKLKLTKTQQDILCHRLEVPDCIADSLTDCEDPANSWEEVANMADWLLDQVQKTGRIDLSVEPFASNRALAAAVIANAVDAGTYCATVADECEFEGTPLKLANVERSGIALASKLTQLLGIPVEFPLG